ncbi:unnamed protein product [Anisakis simplex]|uniref:CHAT domain-containing protein n=1 Tax=Anisakis simplex TaxID=6269 RepID=A0A0M3K8V2_ANISI|nr:unnamed protein product [Anisakis simplex]
MAIANYSCHFSRIGNFFADNGSPRDAEALLNPTPYVSDAVNEVVTEILIHRRTEETDADQLMAEVNNAEQPRDEHQTIQQQTHGMEVEQEADERERITYGSQQSRGESQPIQQSQDRTHQIHQSRDNTLQVQQSGDESQPIQHSQDKTQEIQQSGEEPHQIQRSGEESHQIERSGEQTQQVQESSDEFGEILKELDSAIEEEFVNSIAVEFDLFARNTLALAEKRTEKKRVTRRRQVESKEQEDAWSSALENMDVMMALLSEYCGLNANEKISAEWFIDALNLYRYMCADQKDDERIEESSTGSVQADTEAGESADVDMQVPSAVPVPLSIGRSLQWNARLTYPKTGVAPVFALECGVCKLWTTLPPLGVCQLWSKTDFSHEIADICPKCLSNDTISQMELDCYFYFTANEEPYGSVLILVPHSLVNFYIGGLPPTAEEIVKAITGDKSKEAPKMLEEAASSSVRISLNSQLTLIDDVDVSSAYRHFHRKCIFGAVRSDGLAAAATQDGSSNRWLELSEISRSIRRVMMEKYSIRLEEVLVRGCGPHLKVFEVSSLRSKRNHRKSLARK